MFVVLALLIVTGSASPFTGFYQAVGDCTGTIGFGEVTVISYTNDLCDPSTGTFMGTYKWETNSENSGVLWVTPTSTNSVGGDGPSPGQTYIWNWNISQGGFLGLQSYAGADVLLQLAPPTTIDGSWFFADNDTFIQFVNGMFVSFMFGDNSASTVLGNFMLSGEGNITGVYQYGPDGLLGTSFDGSFMYGGSSLSLDLFDEDGMELVFANGMPQSIIPVWEGPWVGETRFSAGGSCVTTIEFHDNFWMGTQTSCEGNDNNLEFGFFWGVFFQKSDNSLTLTHGYVDMNGQGGGSLPGTSEDFDVEFGEMNGMPQVSMSSAGSFVQLTRLVQF